MKFTDLFIRRPVLATVVSLMILVLGLRAAFSSMAYRCAESIGACRGRRQRGSASGREQVGARAWGVPGGRPRPLAKAPPVASRARDARGGAAVRQAKGLATMKKIAMSTRAPRKISVAM